MKPEKKPFYLNPVSQLFLGAPQRFKAMIVGRGGGKSFGNGLSVSQKIEYMPRAIGGFLGAAFTNILTNTLLPMINAWEKMGYYQDIHYVIGVKPPSYFERPYQPPQRYENVISFWCGHALVMGSMDRPQLLRGGSRDYNISDEALLLDQEMYQQVIVPTVRGSDIRLKDKPHHRNQEFTSSMPYGSLPGEWILEMEEKAKLAPNKYFYIEGTSYHNVEILGEETIRDWRSSMSKIAFAIECMNKRIKRPSSLFYPSLTDHHFYAPKYDYDYIDNLGFNINPEKGATITTPDSRWDADCDPDLPINISHDWGAFNTITIDQYHPASNEVRFINHMFVKHPEIIDDLAVKFCEYYQYQKNRTVYQWGDKSGDKKEANAKLKYFEQFARILEKNKFRVIRQKIGDVGHLDRHNLIMLMHKGDHPALPSISHNAEKCKNLRISLENAGMRDWKKDKRSEHPSSRVKPEHSTHSTDAYDYRLYHGFKHLEKATSRSILPPTAAHFGR